MTQGSVCKLIILFVILLNKEVTLAFKFLSTNAFVHQDITQTAILQKTLEVCKEQALREGRSFVQPPTPLNIESVTKACSPSASTTGFQSAIQTINNENALVDKDYLMNAEYHFHSESFLKGRNIITEGVKAVKETIKQNNFEIARERLGRTLHTLQDFYSHSNWIELGNKFPYSNLIRPDSRIDNIADAATCRSCDGDNCKNNILDNMKKLTSGYFGSFKPSGKCSHGGPEDNTALIDPIGGINKDTRDSSHGHLHDLAATVAITATRELLEDIRSAVGDSNFLRFMGVSQSSVLCFVIDTTGSMGNDIAEVRRVTSVIIDTKTGAAKPSEYILVPFNDPDFGPLIRTTDPVVFKSKINALTAAGGGDAPELSLSGLLLALTGSPPQTEIFLFTDADAKDKQLTNTVLALIERTKSVVSFMLTNSLASRRRREVEDQGQMQQFANRISNPINQIYEDLALASGGQAIEVTKGTLSQATSIIEDISTTTSLVTVFQTTRNPGKVETFSFLMDSSLKNVTIYITGTSLVFNITSPSGDSQRSDELSGKLGLIKHVGNFYTLRLTTPDQTGLWSIFMSSLKTYTIKVTGQSDIDFLFDFVEITQSATGYSVLKGRPAANSNITLLLSMVGGESVTPTEVALVEPLGSQTINGTLENVTGGAFIVTMNSVPAGGFVVRVIGERNSTSLISNEHFQRQSTIQYKASSVAINVQTDETWQPGKTLSVPFTVVQSGSGGLFQINARNDRGFVITFPNTMFIGNEGVGSGTVNLTAPSNTPSGTDVTLTIEAVPPGVSNFNYAVLKLTVVAPTTDFTSPVCEIVSVNANCSSNCSLSSWELSANFTDGNGTGIETVTVRQGLGTINTSTILGEGGVSVTLLFYRASCCSEDLELVAVDKAGNVGTCSKSIRPTVIPSTTIMPTTVTTSTSLFTITNNASATTNTSLTPSVTTNTTLSTPMTNDSNIATTTTLTSIANNSSITTNTPLSTLNTNNASITANISLPIRFTNNASVTTNTFPSTFITNNASIVANTTMVTSIASASVTTNTTLSNNASNVANTTPLTSITNNSSTTYTSLSTTLTNTMSTITTISPSTNATTNSAGCPSYPPVCFWISMGAILLFHMLCF